MTVFLLAAALVAFAPAAPTTPPQPTANVILNIPLDVTNVAPGTQVIVSCAVDDFSSPLAHGSDEELFLYLQAHPPSDASKVVVNTPFSPPEKGPHRMALALPLQVLTLRKDGQVVKAKKYVCWTDLGGLVRGDLSLP